MDVSLSAADSKTEPNDMNPPKISEFAPPQELIAPRELVREVAASLKSLAKVLPYAEYAAIVHHIARLRWRCRAEQRRGLSPIESESAVHRQATGRADAY